jgi:glycerol kinase
MAGDTSAANRSGVVVSIDAGTTGVRSLAVDRSGTIVASVYREFTQHFPQPGWVEHDAEEIWLAVKATLNELIDSLAVPMNAIGITNQRETVVVWDQRTGKPLHRAIVWQDRRTAAKCDELTAAGKLPFVREHTGLVLDPYFSATKLAWLFSEGGVVAGPHVLAGTIDTWLMWNLTGGHVHATDVSNASRTLLFDIRAGAWSDELCQLFNVPPHVLPSVQSSSGLFGYTTATCGVPDGIAIAGVAGDQQAALFGQACFEPGMTKNTYGTGSFVLMNVGTTCPPATDGMLTTVAWKLGDGPLTYALEGAVFVTGAAVQWLRDGLGLIENSGDIGPLAASVPDTGDVYLVPAFTGLGSPWWDPYARGTIIGITRGTTKAHIARAAVEAMAYQSRDALDAMTSTSGRSVREVRVDGGASVNNLLLQFQADQLGVAVKRPRQQETTALGAAFLAGLATGFWESLDEIGRTWQLDVAVEPNADRTTANRLHSRWARAVERSRGWVDPD